MQIVIDIPKDVYEEIMAHNRERREGGKSAYYFEGLIQNGTPLPKGHGRLIDADAFAIRGEYLEKLYGSDFYWEFKKQLDKHPTIIEADKEN